MLIISMNYHPVGDVKSKTQVFPWESPHETGAPLDKARVGKP